MEYAYSILMFIFGAAIFLYGLLVMLTRDHKLIMRHWAAKMTDPKLYARQFGKVLMIVSTAPLVSGLVALIGEKLMIPAVIVLIGGVIGGIVIGIRIMPKDEE